MKTIIILSIFFFSISLAAQDKIPLEKKKPERFDQFEISPKFKLKPSDSLTFSDSLPKLPEIQVHPEIAIAGKDTTDPFRMPVVIIGPGFHSDMPVMVPDSSVHYYIKQAIPERPLSKRK